MKLFHGGWDSYAYLYFCSSQLFLRIKFFQNEERQALKIVQQLAKHRCKSMSSKAGDTLSSRHVSSCDVNACSWDVRGDLTLNSVAQIHTSVTLLTSRDLAWSSDRLKVPARLSNFCCRTHFVRRDVRVERSSDVTSCFQKWRKCLLKKCANEPLYMTPSHQIMEISI